MLLAGKPHVRAMSRVDGELVEFFVRGQTARTLLALKEAGKSGITPQDMPRGFRLAAYIHLLRRKHGLTVHLYRMKTSSGWCGLYILASAVSVDASEWDV